VTDSMYEMNRTSEDAYSRQGGGPGTGAMFSVLGEWRSCKEPFCPVEEKNQRVLEVGFGRGKLLGELSAQGHCVVGVDIARGSVNEFLRDYETRAAREGYVVPLLLDVSHDRIPFVDNFFDYAYCTETYEHLTNPYHATAEVKRVLKHGGKFCVSHPKPEETLGYLAGMHAQVYPWWLMKKSFARFMMQMYFAQLAYEENGTTAWYVYRNIKEVPDGYRMINPFVMGWGNYKPEETYPPEVMGEVDCSKEGEEAKKEFGQQGGMRTHPEAYTF